MRYDISLTIEYSYAQTSDQVRCLLHLLPRDLPGVQDVHASLLCVDPPAQERRDGTDFFGNAATWIAFPDAIDGFTLSLKTRVRRHAAPDRMDLSTSLGALARETAGLARIDADAPHHFLGRSARVPLAAEFTRFAAAVTAPEQSTMAAVMAVGQALHDHLEFDDTATDVHTPPLDAFAQRRGVCQDFTHIMIACLRGLGIPAGYVSGFLRTVPPPGQKRLEGADAMHAWVRAWCGQEAGWIEYDPTNAILAGDGHVVVAYGRDYSDVSPVRGNLRSSGGHDTRHFVDVVPVETP